MNTSVLTAIVLVVALVPGNQGQGSGIWGFSGSSNNYGEPTIQPCENQSSMARYYDFVRKHVLKARFDRTDLRKWAQLLDKLHLCGREEVQTFIDGDEGQIKQVCRGGGKRVRGATGRKGNLCISVGGMTVYDVKSKISSRKCKVTSATRRRKNVILACDKVNNKCLPVHYEKDRGQKPTSQPCSM